MNPVGLYLHIPFCHRRCGYCDFATFVSPPETVDRYLRALQSEISLYQGRSIDTLFIGGGTPTTLEPGQIRDLLSHVRRTFIFHEETEATVEANPESASDDVLSAYRGMGINRLSFGLQAVQDRLLEKLDRLHSWTDFQAAYERARKRGFSNVNVDLMFGLPDQTHEDWTETLERVASLRPEHVSLYALKVEPGTRFDRDGVAVDDDRQADMYLAASNFFKAKGYRHYEISNFALPGRLCRHNLRYWNNQETIGVGLSAASYCDGRRTRNVRRLATYMELVESGRSPKDEAVELKPPDRMREDVLLHLRLDRGVLWRDIEPLRIPVLNDFLQHGLAEKRRNRFVLTPRGWLLSNQLFQHLV